MQKFTPETETELSEIVRDHDGPFAVQGGATRHHPDAGTALSTSKMVGIELYEPGALTIVARAGTPVTEIETALAAEGQMLPFEPMDHRALLGTTGTPTIGGAVALNASGPRRIQAGACRDSLIGVRFVDGRGDVVKSGGRVMKNVTGYDLVKLLSGSRGTLGVLTEVSFKVLPRPDVSTTLAFDGLDAAAAVAVMSSALSSPYQVSGAAHGVGDGGASTVIRVEGFEASVAERVTKLTDGLAGFGAARVVEGSDAELWADIRDAADLGDADGDVWRISARPSDAPRVAAALTGAQLLFDWGGGLIWANVAAGTDVRSKLRSIPGHATLVRATPETFATLGAVPAESAPLAMLATGLRAQFDPRGILNPGALG